ncbi:MAG: anaerobic magnesium-protoporphyrin monomethyl ester cyclase [Acidobacteriota bacterium]|nr:anaerobic magnesium-protoporphyrin monomethyl ester cyclase [Acidobacteriota bacterium]
MTNTAAKKLLIIKPSFKPPKGFGIAIEYPIGMAYVLGCLEVNNLAFDFIDLELSPNWVDPVKSALQENHYYAIATGGLIGSYFFFQQFVSLIRKLNPELPVILGGNIVKDSSDQLLFKTIGIDFGIIGEAENAFPILLRALRGNDKKEFARIPNLVYKNDDGEIIRNRQERIDLANVNILPAWHHFDMSYYSNKALLSQIGDRLKFMPVITGRGCIGKCTFCSPSIGGFRKRPISDVINEINIISSRYDFDFIFFQNELFYPDVRSIREFCKKYIESGLKVPWAASVRVDSNIDVDTFLLMKEARCLEIMGGLESGSEKILEQTRKGITTAQIKTFFNNAKQANLRAWGDFIIGFEGETEQDIKKTIDLLIELDVNGDGAILYVYPGTEVYKNACQKGLIKDELGHLQKITRLFTSIHSPHIKRDIFNVTGMSDSDFVEVATRELRRYLTFKFSRNQIVDPGYRMYLMGENILMRIVGKCSTCGNMITILHKVSSGREYHGILGDGVYSRFLCPHCFSSAAINIYNCTKTTNLKEYFNELKKKISLYKRIILIGTNQDTSLMLRIDLFGIDYNNILGVFDIAGNFQGEYFFTLPVLNKKDVDALKPDFLLVTDCTVDPAHIKQLFCASDNRTPEIVFLADDITRGKIESFMKRIESQNNSNAIQ